VSNGEDQKTMFKLCGLWKQQSADGKTYYSGSLTYSTNLLLFPNKYKEPNNKQPDLILYIAKKEKKAKPADETKPPSEDEVPF